MCARSTSRVNSVVASSRAEARPAAADSSTLELKQLAREVRAATDRVAAWSAEIDRAVESANQRMHEVREQVFARLAELPAPPAASPPAPIAAPPLLNHWVDRLREMVQDASRKGERLSESHEKVSTAAQGVSRHLEEEARDLEGLVARLTPTGMTDETRSAPTHTVETPERSGTRTLRLLDSDPTRRSPDAGAGREGGA